MVNTIVSLVSTERACVVSVRAEHKYFEVTLYTQHAYNFPVPVRGSGCMLPQEIFGNGYQKIGVNQIWDTRQMNHLEEILIEQQNQHLSTKIC